MPRFLNISLSEHHFVSASFYSSLPGSSPTKWFLLMCIFTRTPMCTHRTHISSSLTPLSIPYWCSFSPKYTFQQPEFLHEYHPTHFFFLSLLDNRYSLVKILSFLFSIYCSDIQNHLYSRYYSLNSSVPKCFLSAICFPPSLSISITLYKLLSLLHFKFNEALATR